MSSPLKATIKSHNCRTWPVLIRATFRAFPDTASQFVSIFKTSSPTSLLRTKSVSSPQHKLIVFIYLAFYVSAALNHLASFVMCEISRCIQWSVLIVRHYSLGIFWPVDQDLERFQPQRVYVHLRCPIIFSFPSTSPSIALCNRDKRDRVLNLACNAFT